MCKNLFALENSITSLSLPRLQLQPGEVHEAGIFIDHFNAHNKVPEILQRDGSYPIILTRDHKLVISHRLPDPSLDPKRQDFLVTHRALHNRLLRLSPNSEILYAGQIHVIGGRPSVLIDQSGTFHDRVVDLGYGANDQDLMYANQRRIDFAENVLRPWGLVTEQTKVLNFWERFSSYPPEFRMLGHQTDRKAALFELYCFASPECWQMYKKFQREVRGLIEQGGHEFIQKAVEQNKHLFLRHYSWEHQLVGSMIREGVIEVMSIQSGVIFSGHNFLYEGSPLFKLNRDIGKYTQALRFLTKP